MAALAVQSLALGGLNPNYVAASAGGDTFANDGRTMLHVKNAGAGAVDVTIDSAANCNFGFDHNIVVNVPAGGERMIGPFPPDRFNGANGVAVTYSAIAGVTVAAVKS